MHLSVFFAATFAVAVYAGPHRAAQRVGRDVHYVYDVTTVTDIIYVTEYDQPTSTLSKAPVPKYTPPPAPKATYAPAPPAPSKPAVVVTYAPPPPSSSTPAYVPPVKTYTPPPPPPPPSGNSYLDVCNKYRKLYDLPEFTWSDSLTSNAAQTGSDDGGSNEIHHLFPGSMAQVISPGLVSPVSGVNLGGYSPFEIAYLAWMCEKSSDPQISSLCPTMQSAMNMEYSGTGHYDILTSTSYSQIGCAFAQNPSAASDSPYQGLWVCDLA